MKGFFSDTEVSHQARPRSGEERLPMRSMYSCPVPPGYLLEPVPEPVAFQRSAENTVEADAHAEVTAEVEP